MRPSSEHVALMTTRDLRARQWEARRCMAAHARGDLPADEACASWADRCQDELDRRAAGMPLPEALAEYLIAQYGRTGPRAEGGV